MPTLRFDARAWHATASDPDTGKVVLFGGGVSRSKAQNDTWMFDPASDAWTEA